MKPLQTGSVGRVETFMVFFMCNTEHSGLCTVLSEEKFLGSRIYIVNLCKASIDISIFTDSGEFVHSNTAPRVVFATM